MGKEKISSKGKTTKKAADLDVWEIKGASEKRDNRSEQKPRRSYSDRPERDSQERPRRRSTSPERENSYAKREQKPRKSYSNRPERDSQERPRRRSTSPERENSYVEREQKPRKSYSDRPERNSQERPRRRSTSPERENSYVKREQKPRKSYSDRPERNSQERPRKYSSSRNVSDTGRTRAKQAKKKDELVRLNKFIANSGICSRREADEYIVAGLVSVNGQVITELGTKVKQDDDVRFNKERLKGEKKSYILLNKPKNYITTTDDPHAKKTVMELIEGACKERVYPVGRLDRNSTGVLLFTNDGDLAKQLTHPSYNKLKVYQVRLDRNIAKADIKALVEGVELDDGQAIADSVHVSETNKAEMGIEIHSGRNRIIRRMFEELGYTVVKLDRVYFAGLTKKGLRRGQYRLLTPKEVEMLKMGAYE
ncbi:MAG: pseudouridine synthase [Prevotellaceae bacterium]|jgi:23S rRNA pseudouridine2605 synthase|nr:pseudouridine synthase [Prevotellaceae bacterium]